MVSVEMNMSGSPRSSQPFTVRLQWGARRPSQPSDENGRVATWDGGRGISITARSDGNPSIHVSVNASSNGVRRRSRHLTDITSRRSQSKQFVRTGSGAPFRKAPKKPCATRSVKAGLPITSITSLPTDRADQPASISTSSTKVATTMPDINFIPATSSTEFHHLHSLFEYAIVYLKQSPLTSSNRRKGIDAVFHLLDQVQLANHPVLHAMTHSTIAVNTQFDNSNSCKYKLEHLEKAHDIVLSVLREGHGREKEEGACQGCLYARLQREAGKEVGEEDPSECNTLARLSKVIGEECRRVASFNWGEFDHAST